LGNGAPRYLEALAQAVAPELDIDHIEDFNI
jgi:hypothetical protein